MAYIRKETVQEIRNALKKEFPNLKLSVKKNTHSSTLQVTILKGDVDFLNEIKKERFSYDPVKDGYMDINPYWFADHFHGKSLEVIQKIDEIVKETGNWFDKSEAQIDYFHTAFYRDYAVGSWKKPYEIVETKTSKKKAA